MMQRHNFYLGPETTDKLREQAKAQRVSMAEIVRRAVEKYTPPKPKKGVKK